MRMNEIRLVACFEKTPTDEDKQHIRTELYDFLRQRIPGIELSETSGAGSWWIALGGLVAAAGVWLLMEVGSWIVQKGLDRIGRRDVPSHDEPPSPMPENVSSTDRNAHHDAALFASMGTHMNDLANTLGIDRIRVGEWSEAVGRGRIITLEKKQDETTLTILQTDSKNDFDARFTP